MAKALKEVVCDSSSIIALSETCLLSLFQKFSSEGVKFYLPLGVRKEVVDTPLTTKSFRLEAVRVGGLVESGAFSVIDKEEMSSQVREVAAKIMALANGAFLAEGRPIHLIDYGECDALGLALVIGCPTILVDEKTTRLLIEDPKGLHQSLENRLGKKVKIVEESLLEIEGLLSGLSAIRSCEIVSVAFSRGILSSDCPAEGRARDLLSGALYAVKENGCSVSESEIKEYLEMLLPPENEKK